MNNLKSPADIEPSGSWTDDNTTGRKLAMAYVGEARRLNQPSLINAALRSIAETGRWTGVEAGFAFGLAGAVMQP
jgi:hypothetical protein